MKTFVMILLLTLFCSGCKDEGADPTIEQPVFLGFQDKFALRLVISGSYLYVCAGSDGVWRRNIRQSGMNWQYLGLRDTSLGRYTNVGAVDIDVLSEDILVAYNESRAQIPTDSMVAIWRSTNAGATWARADSGIPQSRRYPDEPNAVNALARSPYEPSTVIAVYGPAIYRSTDDGQHWAFSGRRGVFVNRDRLRWHPSKPGTLWFFGETSVFAGYLYRSTDFGISIGPSVDFVALGFPPDNAVVDVAFDVADQRVVIAATSHGLVKSTDGGGTWRKVESVIPDNGFVFRMIEDPRRPHGVLFAGGNNIYYSSNSAERPVTIARIPDGFVVSLALDSESGLLFIGTTKGVFVLPVGN